MSEAAPPARLIVGEDLRLLRLLLPPLGISLLLAAMIGFAVDALGALGIDDLSVGGEGASGMTGSAGFSANSAGLAGPCISTSGT